MSRRLMIVLLVSLLAVLLAVGCAPQQRPAPDTDPAPQQRNRPLPDIQEGPANRVPDNDARDDTKRADNIANRIDELDGVDEATVIVSGVTAYVGIDMDKDIEGEMTDELKQKVIDTAQSADKVLTRVYVTADADTVQRLRNYAKDIERGQPATGLIRQIEELFRRPAPTR